MSSVSPSQPAARTRVLVADDHEGVRTGVRDLLARVVDFEVVGEAANGVEAVALAAALKPDVVLMDVSMPLMDGLEATRLIIAENSAIRVIILTALRGVEREAYQVGAATHLHKDAAPEELIQCVRVVAA